MAEENMRCIYSALIWIALRVSRHREEDEDNEGRQTLL
jgi:hypothetical protein